MTSGSVAIFGMPQLQMAPSPLSFRFEKIKTAPGNHTPPPDRFLRHKSHIRQEFHSFVSYGQMYLFEFPVQFSGSKG